MMTNPSLPRPTPSMVGQMIGHYRLVRKLGEGGMGMVFEAVHDNVGGRAAIKVLRPEAAGQPEIVARFFNEARAANSIQHPGIVHIFDCGFTKDGLGYLIMEFLAGESLRQRLERVQRLGVAEVLQLGRQLASALHAAHEQRVIHRDLKPDNIMLVPDPELAAGERAKVLDFGIAKVAEELNAQSVRTQSNLILGTPLYMAPEQSRDARHVSDKSDVYSLGVILFQLLAGRPPFIGEGLGELVVMHALNAPPRLSELVPSIPPAVAKLVHGMLEKLPDARPNMNEVHDRIQKLMSDTLSAEITTQTERAVSPAILAAPVTHSPPDRFRPARALSRRWVAVGIGLVMGLAVSATILHPWRSATPVHVFAQRDIQLPSGLHK